MRYRFGAWLAWTALALYALLSGPAAAAADQSAARERSEIEDQYKWDLSSLFPSTAAWEEAYAALDANIGRFETLKGHLGDSPQALLSCLQLNDSLNLINDNLTVYAGQLFDQDQRVTANQELRGRAQGIEARLATATSFIEPEILTIPAERLKSFVDSTPGLGVYRFYLENIVRSKAHILSPSEEEILSLAGPLMNAPRNIYDMIANADVKFGSVVDDQGSTVELTRQRYGQLLESTDRRVRFDANRAFVGAFAPYENTLAAALGAAFQRDWFLAQARKYRQSLDVRLDPDNIPEQVFTGLLDAVGANLEPLHKWTALRKRILGLDTLYTYDMSVPLLKEKPRTYTFEEARQIVSEGLKPLGEKYLADLNRAFESGWIDVYETRGKRSGAYSWGSYTSTPYVLLNFVGSRNNVFTLAHEMGHAMNGRYNNAHEPYIYSDGSLFTAEVASTVNEAALLNYLLETTTDPREKLDLLIYYIEQIENTFYTQVLFSEFEHAMHRHAEKGGAFSSTLFRQTYRDIYQKYWGPALVIDSINDMGCLRIHHFYRTYYVFQYATGYAAAQMIAQRILDREPGAVDALMAFLNTGNSDYPVEILKKAGVDMTSPEPVNRTIKLFADLVNEVERLLDEQ